MKKTELRNRVDEVQEWAANAQWLEELARVAKCAVDPGKKMVVQEITFDSAAHTPGIALRNVYGTDSQVLFDFIRRLNEVTVDGQDWFAAKPGTISEVRGGELFKSKTDVQIELCKLRDFRIEATQREKARKDALRSL